MDSYFYDRCKRIVANLELTYEQGIARDVVLNMLDMEEKQSKDCLKRINDVITYLKQPYRDKYDFSVSQILMMLGDGEENE